jgi:hypothetical protein
VSGIIKPIILLNSANCGIPDIGTNLDAGREQHLPQLTTVAQQRERFVHIEVYLLITASA